MSKHPVQAARSTLGRTLIIVNPAAQSGAAAEIGERLQRFLKLYLHDQGAFDLVQTERPRQAIALASRAAGYDTVLAVGGDGIAHEVAGGLMHIRPSARPALGIVPVGSGNDYARTLGMPEVSRDDDMAALLDCERTPIDIGRLECTGTSGATVTEHFVQTFSYGMDAAIALGTFGLRKQTGLAGDPLYLLSGMKALGRGYRDFPAMVSIDGAPAERMRTVTFAVQIGPTYGSGFKICPKADPADGLLDICYVSGPMPRSRALPLLLSAKFGRHTHAAHTHILRARSVTVSFEEAEPYPAQADGERVEASRIAIGILPGALTVLRPRTKDKQAKPIADTPEQE